MNDISPSEIEARLKALMGTKVCANYCSMEITFTAYMGTATETKCRVYTDKLGWLGTSETVEDAFGSLDADQQLRAKLAEAEAEAKRATEKAENLRAALANRSQP